MKFVAALALAASMTQAMESHRGGYRLPEYGGHRHGGRGRGYGQRSYRPAVRLQETVYAKCMLKDPEEENYLGGTINMMQKPYGELLIWGDVWGVEPGKHGFHVHQTGDLRQGCKSLDGHYNGAGGDGGYGSNDGSKNPNKRFMGDLVSAQANRNGDARIDQKDPQLQLSGKDSIIGRSLVLHGVLPKDKGQGKGGDSYGNGGGNAGEAAGNGGGDSYGKGGSGGGGYTDGSAASGPRIACCTIGLSAPPKRSGYGYGGGRQGRY